MTKQKQEDRFIRVGKYKIKIDKSLCIGDSTCAAISPRVFEINNNFKAVVKEGSLDIPENLILAAQSCPVSAIVIIDTETGKQIWPK